MIVSQSHVYELLTSNPKWTSWFPYVKGLEFHEIVANKLKEKVTMALSFMIEKQMSESEKTNGNQFAMDVWRYCAAELSKIGWANVNGSAKYGPRGGLKVTWTPNPVAIWKRIYKSASLKVQKEIGFKPIGSIVDKALDGYFK